MQIKSIIPEVEQMAKKSGTLHTDTEELMGGIDESHKNLKGNGANLLDISIIFRLHVFV